MRRLLPILCLTLAVLLGSTGMSESADFQKGADAFNRRDYATALREWKSFAEQGDELAQFFMGAMYDEGLGVPQNYKTAVKWYRLAAEQGHADAQNNLGSMYRLGKGVPQDYGTSVKWYRLAAEQGYAVAQLSLGGMYRKGRGVSQDYKTAVKWYTLAAEQGNAHAQYRLGWRYRKGEGVPQNHKTAVKWYRLAADQGYADAQHNLGVMYANGRGVPRDYKTAVKWFRLAAEQGHAGALTNLGQMYENGNGIPQDYKTAVKWYRLAAEQLDADAQFNDGVAQAALGKAYFLGQGVPQDFSEALKWLRKAARQGTVDAYGPLVAIMHLDIEDAGGDTEEAEYWLDKFVTSATWIKLNNTALWLGNDPDKKYGWSGKNEALALDLMLQAASNSPSEGPMGGAPETTLGWWYLTGEHEPAVPIDNKKSLYWTSLGAVDDHPNALTNLALMYATGIGVERDYGQAVLLHLRAIEVFSKEHDKFLYDPDDWPEFKRAKVPARFMEAHNLYLKAISEKTGEPVSALRASLVMEPPKSIQWGACQLEEGGYDNNGNWVDLNGRVSAFGSKRTAEACLEQVQIPKTVFDRFMVSGSPTDKIEASELKVAFVLRNSELIPNFESIGKEYCQGIAENSLHKEAEIEVCISREFLGSSASVSKYELKCETDDGRIYTTLQTNCEPGDRPIGR
jgi:uncharacterized protein